MFFPCILTKTIQRPNCRLAISSSLIQGPVKKCIKNWISQQIKKQGGELYGDRA